MMLSRLFIISGPHIQAVDIFDPFLPCNSHHIRGRRRATATTNGANNTSSSEQPQQPQAATESNTNTPPPESAASGSSGPARPSVPTVQMTLLSSGNIYLKHDF